MEKKIGELLHKFDTSNFSTTNKNFTLKNKNMLGYWKDEMGSELMITEVIAPRAKVYYIEARKANSEMIDETIKKCKGVQKIAVQDQIKKQNYSDAVFLNKATYCDFHKITSKNHTISTVKVRKRAMNGFEDKRYLCKYQHCFYLSYGFRVTLFFTFWGLH